MKESEKVKLSLEDLRIEVFQTAGASAGTLHGLSGGHQLEDDSCTDGCTKCTGCSNCTNCSNCSRCTNCSGCSNCTNCSSCTWTCGTMTSNG